MTPPKNNFPRCPAHQSMIWAQNPLKKMKINHESNFRRGFGGWNFPNKIQKYGNFEIELERANQQYKVYFATYMCKKGLFLPYTSARN